MTVLRDATEDHDRVLLATAAAIVTLAIVLFMFVNGAMPTYMYVGFLGAFVVASGILHAADISPPEEFAEAATEVTDEGEDEDAETDDDAEGDDDENTGTDAD